MMYRCGELVHISRHNFGKALEGGEQVFAKAVVVIQ
jgi:hypothetical protein